ncbi:hypothetical protein EV356DRAFT_294116 [Viridothelium virens]|uniref:Mid2 domain-containing protein n=1 Tax=Viridothelium virens TaxID=1048519 RepID=A0A6A6H167_VIRVR|nr:hypothetical protein EV356DRAFT_294116 [Viridothelium virens]
MTEVSVTTHSLETETDIFGYSTVTSWLPLTPAFPSVSGCNQILWGTADGVAWDPNIVANPGNTINDMQCLPAAVRTWWLSTSQSASTSYSLGPIVCPEAYRTAFTSEFGSSTFLVCCPLSYYYQGPGDCISTATSGEVFTIYPKPTDSWTGPSITTITSTSLVDGIPISGWNIRQVSPTPTSSARPSIMSPWSSVSLTTAMSSNLSSSSSPSSLSSNPASSSNSHRELSSGAVAGIGVGASLTLGALIGVCALLYCLRRRSKMSSRAATAANERQQQFPPDSNQDIHAGSIPEISGREIFEIPTEERVHELPGEEINRELPAEPHHP